MKFIRPYGETVTEMISNRGTKRRLRLLDKYVATDKIIDVKKLHQHAPDKLILGMMIGTLDKIIKKPTSGKAPDHIYKIRQKIGDELADIFKKEYLKEGDNQGFDQDGWQRKLHPYQQKKLETKEKKFQGRLYPYFVPNKK